MVSDPTYAVLYAQLGLTPLDAHIQAMGAHQIDQSEIRRLGSTTWMQVAAADNLLDGNHSQIVGPTSRYAQAIAREVVEIAQQRGLYVASNVLQTSQQTRFTNDSILVWGGSEKPPLRGYANLRVFSDEVWRERAIRRLKGPYDMVRFIREVNTPEGVRILGFAEDDECTVEFTPEGAWDFVQRFSPAIEPGPVLLGAAVKQEAANSLSGYLGD